MNTYATGSWRRALPRIGNTQADTMNARTLYALSALIFLVQLPHLPTLPLWASALGCTLVAARLLLLRNPSLTVLATVLSPLGVTIIAAASALLIRWDYGYFIGRDPCVGFLFILVAAKFAEVRRAQDATTLLCLCAFLLLTQYFYSQTILSAALTLPAVFALAYSLSILRDWRNPDGTLAQLKMISALLVQGLPLAAVLFMVFPRLPGPLWSLPEDAMATTGLSDSMSPGSIGSLSLSDAVAFRIDFDGEIPTSSQLYWRGPVLTEFDGRNWGISATQVAASPGYSGPESALTNYTVTLQAHRQRWLFALDSATTLPSSYNATQAEKNRYSRVLGQMYDDGQILATDTVSQTLRYRQSSILSDTIPSAGPVRNETLYLPGQNTRAIEFARNMRSSATNDLAYAQAIMKHFNTQAFRYTLQPQTLGHSPIDEFLFDTLEGFCEHYASAFVVLMRAAGIPARVVTGYQGGEMNEDYMIVRQSNAHAWTEAYIDGLWRRFDPTAAVAPSRVEGGLAAALPNESAVPRMARQAPGFLRDMQLRWDAINHHWQRLVIDFDNDSQAGLWERTGLDMPSPLQLSLIMIAIAGIWSAVVLGLPRYESKKLPRQERSWQSLTSLLHARGMTRLHNESPSEYLERAARQWPSHELRWQRIQTAFAQLRFQRLDTYQQQLLQRQIQKDVVYMKLALRFRAKLTSTQIKNIAADKSA